MLELEEWELLLIMYWEEGEGLWQCKFKTVFLGSIFKEGFLNCRGIGIEFSFPLREDWSIHFSGWNYCSYDLTNSLSSIL